MNRNDNHWFFVSLYYARNNWPNLLTEISNFRKSLRLALLYFSILFSQEKGDCIKLTISISKKENYKDIYNLINDHFISYISTNKSVLEKEFDFGKVLWCNFDNNSVIWNKYKLNTYNTSELEYIDKTSHVVLNLIDGDSSHDNFYSIALFLLIKLLKNVEVELKINIINQIIKIYSMEFSQFGDYDFVTNNFLKQLKINLNDIFQIMNSYWNESYTGVGNSEYTIWINYIKRIAIDHNIYMLIDNVFLITGLNSVERMFIIEILDKWMNENRNVLS